MGTIIRIDTGGQRRRINSAEFRLLTHQQFDDPDEALERVFSGEVIVTPMGSVYRLPQRDEWSLPRLSV